MKIEFDPDKSEKNNKERGLQFDAVGWETALVSADDRYVYPEPRFVALGFIDGRLHVICFTPISGGIRVISFRKANEREIRRYDQETADQ